MKYSFLAFLLLIFSACQTTKIKKNNYKVSVTAPELGSLGQAKSSITLQNDFNTRTFPKLENKIRVAVEVIPYNKKLNKIYTNKAKFNQNQAKVIYSDSLPTKPEIVTIQILDVTGFVNELNADYNEEVFRVMKDLQNLEIVSSIAVNLSSTDIAKIRLADAYYLTNVLDKKYTLTLLKQGKKVESIDLTLGTILGYRLSKLCWAETTRGKWYIADMITTNSSCKGTTSTKAKNKKKEENLFKM